MSKADVFAAIAHPIRRKILTTLAAEGDVSLTQLAESFCETRQAVRKHVRILSEAQLVELARRGREQRCILRAAQLAEIQEWVALFERFWDTKLQSLKGFVEETSVQREEVMGKKKAARRTAATPRKKATPKVSSVKGKTVAWYISELGEPQASIVQALDLLITATIPKATSSIKWAQPVYEADGPFCFIKAAKNHVTFGFWRGVELTDQKGLLEGSGDKMRHIKLKSTDDIQKTVFKALLKEAVRLNRKQGDPSR